MSKGQIHNTTGTICKAKKRACPLDDSGHSSSIEAYVEHHVKESGINGEEVTAMIADGTPPADAVEVAKLGVGTVNKTFSKTGHHMSHRQKKELKRKRKRHIPTILANDKKLYNPRGMSVKVKVGGFKTAADTIIKLVDSNGVETKYERTSHPFEGGEIVKDAKKFVERYNRMEDYISEHGSSPLISPSSTNVYNPRNLDVVIHHSPKTGPMLSVNSSSWDKPDYVFPGTYNAQAIQDTVDKMISNYNRKKDEEEAR